MTALRRTKLGSTNTFAGQFRVYETADALEVDEVGVSEIYRRRVFYDDVRMITRHQRIGWLFVVSMGLLGGLLLLIALIMLNENEPVAGLIFLVIGLCPLALMLLRLILKLDIITVYGKRSKADLQFWFRKARARQVFEDLAAKVQARQSELAAQIAAEEAAASAATENAVPLPRGPGSLAAAADAAAANDTDPGNAEPLPPLQPPSNPSW